MNAPLITVLTPTYNRQDTLGRLWESLCAQTQALPFEWLLVDDGSTDDTKIWFDRIHKPSHIQAQYVKQANHGKHVAINAGVRRARGEWIFIVDSDDALTTYAIETVLSDDSQMKVNPRLVGLSYRKSTLNGALVGRAVEKQEPMLLKPNEAGALFQGDLAYIFRKTALVENPFPVIANEKFVPELLIWNKIADNGDILYFPQTSIYLCEYLPDGYSATFKSMLRRNPRGFSLFYRDQIRRLNLGVRWIKAAIRYCQCQFYGWTKP